MPVSRRLRFEILRRDNHTCRYCGAMAPDVTLTVDHVVPVTLGGSDEPTNLVTACTDCNSGKSSIPPDAERVADVQNDALRWARAIESAATALLAEREVIDDMLSRFSGKWNTWTYNEQVTIPAEPIKPSGDVLVDHWRSLGHWHTGNHSRPVGFADGVLRIQVERGWASEVRGELRRVDTARQLAAILGAEVTKVEILPGWPGPLPAPPQATFELVPHTIDLPSGWESSVERFYSLGLPESEIHRLVDVAMEAPNVRRGDIFRYFCGCCWRRITDLQEDARRIIESESNT